MVGGAQGAVWVKNAPDIADRSVGGYETMGERQREHVEVTHGDDEMASFSSAVEEFGHLPGLSGAVADITVVGFALIWCMSLDICVSRKYM